MTTVSTQKERNIAAETATRSVSGYIYDLKKYAIHDGPGIRTTVFLKGCPLDCWWCHNPESRDPKPEPRGNMRPIKNLPLLEGNGHSIGAKVSVAALMQEIRKDVLFFDESGGGVTFSGGEPLMQPEFLIALLRTCKTEGIHTVVDTSGYIPFRVIKETAPWTDLFLYDIKLMDESLHKKYTGVSNRRILDNLLQMDQGGYPLLIRIPLIPGFTDTDGNLEAIRNFLLEKTRIRDVELLPYNSMGESKYERLGLDYRPGKHAMPAEEEMATKRAFFREKGFRVRE